MKNYLFVFILLIIVKPVLSENYAILISGDKSQDYEVEETYMTTANDTDEFWNDLFLVWETLYSKGFKDENIFVFFEEGTGTNSPDRYDSEYLYSINDIVDYDTEKSTILDILADLENGDNGLPELTEDDFLFIWTFGHGGASSNDTTLIVWNNTITDTEFASYLDDIAYDKRIVWMQQCYSGGFIDNLSNSSTVIITACEPDEFAYRVDEVNPDGADTYESDLWNGSWSHHGEFNYHCINAANLKTIIENTLTAPDKDSNGKTSIQEIYDWADSTESSKTQHPVGNKNFGPQHPQIDDDGNNAGSVFIDVDPPEVTISGSVVSSHPKISWTAPDIQDIDEYEVWRYRTAAGGGYTLRATVTGTTYTDNAIIVNRVPPYNQVYYKVKVVDNADNKSEFSNIVNFYDGSTSKPIVKGGENINIPEEFALKQNYPNPFNPETKIQFGLPEDSNVKLQIFNIQGQIVATLFDGALAAGFHTATFDATSFPSGVYFYKLVAGNFTDIKRMLLVK